MVFCSTRWRILTWFDGSKPTSKPVSKSIRFEVPVRSTYQLRDIKPVNYKKYF